MFAATPTPASGKQLVNQFAALTLDEEEELFDEDPTLGRNGPLDHTADPLPSASRTPHSESKPSPAALLQAATASAPWPTLRHVELGTPSDRLLEIVRRAVLGGEAARQPSSPASPATPSAVVSDIVPAATSGGDTSSSPTASAPREAAQNNNSNNNSHRATPSAPVAGGTPKRSKNSKGKGKKN